MYSGVSMNLNNLRCNLEEKHVLHVPRNRVFVTVQWILFLFYSRDGSVGGHEDDTWKKWSFEPSCAYFPFLLSALTRSGWNLLLQDVLQARPYADSRRLHYSKLELEVIAKGWAIYILPGNIVLRSISAGLSFYGFNEGEEEAEWGIFARLGSATCNIDITFFVSMRAVVSPAAITYRRVWALIMNVKTAVIRVGGPYADH